MILTARSITYGVSSIVLEIIPQFDVAIGSAVRPDELQKLFLEHRPRIVHFSGHGAGEEGLVLESDAGQVQLVSTQALSNLFKNFAGTIECVLLNACYSEVQANAIGEHINYVIGMNEAIQDRAAIYFTRGFYQALGNGESIEQSYELGRNAIELQINNASTTRSESATTEARFVSTQALSNLFKAFADTIESVLLNACYSEVQSNDMSKHINYVIGMSPAIQDKTALYFARGFYRALEDGQSIEQSYESGRNEIELHNNTSTTRLESATTERKFIPQNIGEVVNLPEHLKPVLKMKPSLTVFSMQAPSQAEISNQHYQAEVQNDFNLGQATSRTQPLTRQENRQRKSLLSHVKSAWIEGVLEPSLHNRTLLKLDLEKRPDAVQRSSRGIDGSPTEPDQSLGWLRGTDIFDQMGTGRTLLILGEPGSGKTIELLNLAKRLIERTEQDLSRPIPVVFNLSSWAIKRLSIADWLAEELKDQYSASKALGEEWVKQEELLLLIDGLDEVQAEHRNDCVRALNQFLEDHSTTEMVVCSRLKDYEKLSERLKLRSAIYIRPITPRIY